jgi:hypothetical protein
MTDILLLYNVCMLALFGLGFILIFIVASSWWRRMNIEDREGRKRP